MHEQELHAAAIRALQHRGWKLLFEEYMLSSHPSFGAGDLVWVAEGVVVVMEVKRVHQLKTKKRRQKARLKVQKQALWYASCLSWINGLPVLPATLWDGPDNTIHVTLYRISKYVDIPDSFKMLFRNDRVSLQLFIR